MRSASRSASWEAWISSIALRRSATSVSRALNTFSSADTALARAGLRLGLGLGLGFRGLGDGDGALLLGQLQGLAALDLQALDLLLLVDAVALQLEIGRDARALDLMAGGDLGLLRLLLLLGALARDLGALPGPAHLQRPLMIEPGRFARLVDDQGLLLRLQILVPDLDHRVLLDVVADLLAPLDLLGELGQALGVEGVGGVEELHIGLVEAGEGHRLQLQPVLQQILGRRLLHPLHIFAALLMHLLHAHLGGDGAQRIDELALHQLAEGLGMHGALAQGLGGIGDGVGRRLDAEIELGDDIDPHPVLGDERPLAPALHLQAQRVHIDRDHLVDDRQHEGAAVHHHLLAAEAGAHEGHLLGGPAIEPVHQIDDDGDDDRQDDDRHDDGCDGRHGLLPVRARPQPRPISLNLRVCAVRAISVGRRSMLEAP